MGYLLNGKWVNGDPSSETGKAGTFERIDSVFRDRVTADGSSGFKAEAGRYHLYVAHSCPWAHRAILYRSIKKLENAITISHAIPGLREGGWTYESNPNFPDCLPDTITDMNAAQDAYAEQLRGAGLVLCLGSMLHSIATGNMLPSWVKIVCVDINPAVATKVSDRGTGQAVGVVTDVGLFLDLLSRALVK